MEQGYRTYYKSVDGILTEFIKILWEDGFKILSTITLERGNILFLIETIKENISFTEDELKQVLNNCLNDAMCRSGRIKHPHSNAIAEFINTWYNLDKIRTLIKNWTEN